MGGSRLRAKKSVSSAPHSAARTPATRSAVWFRRGSAAKLYRLPDAPAFAALMRRLDPTGRFANPYLRDRFPQR